jgi:hypothetical protein
MCGRIRATTMALFTTPHHGDAELGGHRQSFPDGAGDGSPEYTDVERRLFENGGNISETDLAQLRQDANVIRVVVWVSDLSVSEMLVSALDPPLVFGVGCATHLDRRLVVPQHTAICVEQTGVSAQSELQSAILFVGHSLGYVVILGAECHDRLAVDYCYIGFHRNMPLSLPLRGSARC